MKILLSGIVGSTAYGLVHEGSDVDRLGMYAVDTAELHGLHRITESYNSPTKPDITLHEAGKWCRLALGGNPTVMELAWLPDDLYEVRTPLGDDLIAIRQSFLSAPRVRDAYLGYATQQFRKLESRGGTFGPDLVKRTAKHARHMYRLLMQGFELWTGGTLTLRVDNPSDVMDFGQEVADGDLRLAKEILAEYVERFDDTPTVLPHYPDEKTVEEWLRRVRREFFT